jgi:hypothetical protein
MRLPRIAAGCGLVVLLFVVTSCAQVPVASAPTTPPGSFVPTPTPTPTESAAPTGVVETGYDQPQQVFDGDCSAIFTNAEVSGIVDNTVKLLDSSAYLIGALGSFSRQGGGVSCTWESADSSAGLMVVVLPEGSANDQEEDTKCGELDTGDTLCAVDETANGVRISGVMTGYGAKKATLLKRVAALESVFIERTSALAIVPTTPIPNPDAWSMPVDCAGVAERIDLEAAFGVSGPYNGDSGGAFDEFFAEPIAFPGGKWPTCYASPKKGEDYVIYTILGGGRWAEPLVAEFPGTKRKDVAGVDAVYVTTTEYNKWINIFDGVNWVSVDYSSSKSVAAGVAVVAALNSE